MKYKGTTKFEPGLIYAPYHPRMKQAVILDNEYRPPSDLQNRINDVTGVRSALRKNRDEYYENHSCCPKCGSTNSGQTLMGCIMRSDSPESYKDENEARCACGDVHTVHDRVPPTITS